MSPYRHFRLGLHYGFPLCCVLRFSWGVWRGEWSQARDRGVCYRLRNDGSVATWVPCRCGAHGSVEFVDHVQFVESVLDVFGVRA